MPQGGKMTYDDILTSISSFGFWQIVLYVATCSLVILPSTLQVIGLVFFAGTPRFHCVTPNVTCEENKCCTNCTEYVFDGPFTSSVSEVRHNVILRKILNLQPGITNARFECFFFAVNDKPFKNFL